MPKLSASASERAKTIEELKALLHPGDTLYTILRHVSASGMTRHITPYFIRIVGEESVLLALPYSVALVTGCRYNKQYHAVTMLGCGMDMGFALVYRLGRTLWPDGFECPPGYHRNGPQSFDTDGGYALHHRWL